MATVWQAAVGDGAAAVQGDGDSLAEAIHVQGHRGVFTVKEPPAVEATPLTAWFLKVPPVNVTVPVPALMAAAGQSLGSSTVAVSARNWAPLPVAVVEVSDVALRTRDWAAAPIVAAERLTALPVMHARTR